MLLVPAVARFAQLRPEVEVAILDGLSGSVLDAVAEGQADAGLTVKPAPRATLAYKPLLSDEFGLVCRPVDALAGDGSLPWSAFEGRPGHPAALLLRVPGHDRAPSCGRAQHAYLHGAIPPPPMWGGLA